MLELFYSLKSLENNGGVVIKRYTLRDNHDLSLEPLKLPAQMISNKWGFPITLCLPGKTQIICNDGLFQLDEETKEFNLIDTETTALTKGSWGKILTDYDIEAIYYEPIKKEYLKLYHDCHYYETYFNEYYRKEHKLVYIADSREQEEIAIEIEFDFHLIRINKKREYMYPANDSRVLRYLESKNIWELSDYSMDEYNKASYEMEWNLTLKKILQITEDLVVSMPSSYAHRYCRKKKEFSHILKFGCDLTYRDALPIFKSTDLKDWQELSYLTQCHRKTQTEYYSYDTIHSFPIMDTYPCLIYDEYHDIYLLYTRANLHYGSRYIQLSTSKDLKTWSSYRLINMDPIYQPEIGVNYYTPSFYKLRGSRFVFAVISVCDEEEQEIRYDYMISSNYVDFYLISTIFSTDFKSQEKRIDVNHTNKHMMFIPASYQETDKYWDFFGIPHTKVMKHKIYHRLRIRREGFTSISSVKGMVGTFVTKPLVIDSERPLQLNYRCSQEGWITMALLDSNGRIKESGTHESFHTLTGDQIRGPILWHDVTPESGDKLEVRIYDGEIFALSGAEFIHRNRTDYPLTHLKYYYYEHTNRLLADKIIRDYEDGKPINNNGWRTTKLLLPTGVYGHSLVGEPIYRQKMTIISQRVLLTNGHTIEVPLVNNMGENEAKKVAIRRVTKNHFIKKGTSALIININLADENGNEDFILRKNFL